MQIRISAERRVPRFFESSQAAADPDGFVAALRISTLWTPIGTG
jgi:hypothetical protein